jgi:hypothetical protein
MRRTLLFYSFSTFVLLPIATILGFACIMAIPSVLGTPPALLDVFVLLAFVLYTFTSFYFFIRGVQGGKTLTAFMKDFIKANGYVVLVSSVLYVVVAALFYTVPAVKNFIVEKMMQMQPLSPKTAGIDRPRLESLTGKALSASAVYSALLIAHFIVTLKLIKKYSHVFAGREQ